MAKQTIDLGTAPTGAGGDTFRAGSAKLQANDDELYAQLGATAQGVLPAALPVSKGGTGATTAAAARTSLGLGTAATRDVTGNGLLMSEGAHGFGGTSPGVALPKFFSGASVDQLKRTQMINSSGDIAIGYGTGLYWSAGGSRGHALIGSYSNNNLYHCTVSPLSEDPVSRVITKSIVRTAANTTVDSNGFLKNASPIVQLYADKIELNDEAKLQNITFEKLGIGDYLIKGSSGFAQEGWYVETPKDANGNVLFSVIYTTLENGDISVKTYKKKFDFETVSIVADLDNPVDITENRWIDIRLQELPQPEIEIPESIAPPEFQPTGLAEAVATVMESYHDPEQ